MQQHSSPFEKEVLHPGRGDLPYIGKNTKVIFHFRAMTQPGEDGSVIDDTRRLGAGPFELLIGRDFKLGVWEDMVKTMRVTEIAQFLCPFESVLEYPRVSQSLRELAQQKAGKEVHHHHHCSFAAMHGTGHKDLDKILGDKTPLLFEFELLRVEQPGEYKQDHWAMSEQEKSRAVPVLKEEGNTLYKEGKHLQAADKYFEALGYLEQLLIREKPGSDAWHAIALQKVPLLLNYSQCKLLLEDYAEVIRHTSSVLEVERDNVKALYRRGRANAACWNIEETKMDFARVVELDPSLSRAVDRELKGLMARVKEKDVSERERLRGKLF